MVLVLINHYIIPNFRLKYKSSALSLQFSAEDLRLTTED